MRIREQSSSRMVITGIPGRRIWMIVCTGIGLLLTAAVLGFAYIIYVEQDGLAWPHLAFAFGLLIAQLIFWTGVITLAVGRVVLTLNKTTGKGEYQVRSPIIDAGTPCKFALKDIHDLAIESAPVEGSARDEFPSIEHRLRLRLNRPRRAITLDETQHNQTERLREMGNRIAEFLGIELRTDA